MTSTCVAPPGSQASRVGPVFCTKDQCAFVKVSSGDSKRAVVNMTSMTLVDYADKSEYPEGALRSDQSLFVPIFCKECYGTDDNDYAEALASIGSSCPSDKFLVGMCSVFGAAEGEVYPESRKDFIVGNDMSYSGACHPQPGKAVYLHKDKKDIGRVKCYWHVHSRTVDKTFLYCCVACDDNEYTDRVVKPELSMGFSLGTVGDNRSGPITEECSLVSVPMRPGCFCTLVTGKDLTRTMTRFGFSTLKDSVLDAGINLKESVELVQTETPSDTSDESSEGRSVTEIVTSLRKIVLDQAAEIRVLKDVLEAIKVQNSVLTQRLKCPDDPDTLFTVRGAKDFTRRTGVKTKLCAGLNPIDKGTISVLTETTGDTPDPKREQMEDAVSVPQTQICNLIKLLQQQQQQQQQQPQQPPLPQQQQQSQAHLHALQSLMQLTPTLQHMQHPWNPLQQQQQQTGHGFFGGHSLYNPSGGASAPGDKQFQSGTLTEAQRRNIAIEYNKEESDRDAVSRKEQDRMLDSIKASIRDVMLEQQRGSLSQQESSSNQSNVDTLHSLARGTPYKRARKQADGDPSPEDISTLMKEIRALSKHVARASDKGASEESCQVVTMDTDAGEPAPAASDRQQYAHQFSPPTVTDKQQAGYAVPSGVAGSTSTSLADFVSAVVAKK